MKATTRQMRPDEMHRTPVQREVDAMLAQIEAARRGDPIAPLTADDYASLTSGRNVAVKHKAASLVVRWTSLRGFSGLGTSAMPREMRFVMTGPSGQHTLLVAATDLARLNAHWIVFASHPLNQ